MRGEPCEQIYVVAVCSNAAMVSQCCPLSWTGERLFFLVTIWGLIPRSSPSLMRPLVEETLEEGAARPMLPKYEAYAYVGRIVECDLTHYANGRWW